ncbi:MAG: phosphatase PAP2 family protein [Spirochaetes bacterium]|nr:phosphatase PAP2 family protein [Spirochaetota bacterium]
MGSFFANTVLFGEDILNRVHIFAGPWLDAAMVGVTSLGSEIFYMAVIPVLYWCWDRRRAAYICAAYLTAMAVNDSMKCLFNNPRPDPAHLLPGIQEMASRYRPRGPGFPSGHAQGSVAFWGTLAVMTRGGTMKALCALMIILVSYSRLYLAVHYLGDVLGGLVLGILCLAVIIPAAIIAEKYYRSISQIILITLLIIIPITIFIFVAGDYMNTTMGALSGFMVGVILAEEKIRFNPWNRLPIQLVKIVIGISVLGALRFGLKYIVPEGLAAGFFRYWCIGFWCSFGAPFVFSKFAALRGEEKAL